MIYEWLKAQIRSHQSTYKRHTRQNSTHPSPRYATVCVVNTWCGKNNSTATLLCRPLPFSALNRPVRVCARWSHADHTLITRCLAHFTRWSHAALHTWQDDHTHPRILHTELLFLIIPYYSLFLTCGLLYFKRWTHATLHTSHTYYIQSRILFTLVTRSLEEFTRSLIIR